jgi:NADH dehydrogenase
MPIRRFCILGGTGFIGRALAARLSGPAREINILTRASARHRDLLVLPGVILTDGDVHNGAFLRRQLNGVDVVVNLIGILNERRHSGAGFRRAHVELAEKIAAACREEGVRRLLHMSALGANARGPSHYLRTKAVGEDAAHAAAPDVRVTSFRPAVVFGARDSFLNRFARLLNLAPGIFPLACPEARLQPVYVEDVAHAMADSIDMHRATGERYELCGPTVYRLRDIVAYIAALRGRRARVIGLSDRLSRWQASLLEYVPGKPFSLDNYHSLGVENVCHGDNGLRSVFGIEPTPMEQVAPGFLAHS